MLYYFVCVSFQDEEIDPLDAFMVQVDQQVQYRGLKFEVNWSACGGLGRCKKIKFILILTNLCQRIQGSWQILILNVLNFAVNVHQYNLHCSRSSVGLAGFVHLARPQLTQHGQHPPPPPQKKKHPKKNQQKRKQNKQNPEQNKTNNTHTTKTTKKPLLDLPMRQPGLIRVMLTLRSIYYIRAHFSELGHNLWLL